MNQSQEQRTHFGFQEVKESEKAVKVKEVFDSVATNYDIMNDLMSLGMHRLWKRFTIRHAKMRPGMKALDIAGGTGDLSLALAKCAGSGAEVWHTDINLSMLKVGRDRLLDKGFVLPTVVCDAEQLPFEDNYFDVVTLAFGLRNMTHKEKALGEIFRVLKPGGHALILEFSHVCKPLTGAYDWYSFNVLPFLGSRIANDSDSYRYLAESIRMHPDQETLAQMMKDEGFARVKYFNMSAGVVALHEGYKII